MPVSRAELTEEFFDRTSAILLRQPEPVRPYANLMKMATGMTLATPSAIGMPGRPISGQGAPYAAHDRDAFALSRDLGLSELFAVSVDFKGEPGHTLRFNRPVFADSTYTMASRQIGTNQTISVVPITAGSEQNSLTIKRFGGPYDTTNTRVAPYALDNFDASMGVHNLAQFVGTHLGRDFDKTLESFWVALLDTAANDTTHIIYPDGMAADDDCTGANQFGLTYEQMSRTSKLMDEANLPTLPDGRRVWVCSPAGKKSLKDDPQFARYAKDFGDTNPLQSMGWFNSTPEFHCFMSNNLSSVANSSSISIDRAHAIAPSSMMAGVGKPPRVAPSSDDNYGETAKVIWLGYFVPALADARFVYQPRYPRT